MSATNSGVTPEPGFSYVNQLLFYATRRIARARRRPGGDRQQLRHPGDELVRLGQSDRRCSAAPGSRCRRRYRSPTTRSARAPRGRSAAAVDSAIPTISRSFSDGTRSGWRVRAVYGFLAPTGAFEPGTNTQRRDRVTGLTSSPRARPGIPPRAARRRSLPSRCTNSTPPSRARTSILAKTWTSITR